MSIAPYLLDVVDRAEHYISLKEVTDTDVQSPIWHNVPIWHKGPRVTKYSFLQFTAYQRKFHFTDLHFSHIFNGFELLPGSSGLMA